MAQDPLDDVITLGTQKFAIKGNVQGNAASEFETGIKVGPPSKDHREHAFFLGLNDFSGGFGSRIIDIREEAGNYWYPEDNSPETAFAGRITLPLKQELISITAGPTYAYHGDVSSGWITHSTGYLFALGTSVYRLHGLSNDPDRLLLAPLYGTERFISAFQHVVTSKYITRSRHSGNASYTYTVTAPAERLYFCYGGGLGHPIISTDNGTNWYICDGKVAQEPGPDDVTDLSINIVSKVYKANKGVQLAPIAPSGSGGGSGGLQPSGVGAVRYNMFATFNGGYRTLNLFKGATTIGPTLGDTSVFSTTNAGRVFFNHVGKATSEAALGAESDAFLLPSDLLYWDKKLLGVQNVGVAFCVPSSSFNIRESIDWSFDYDGYYIDLSYTDNNGDVQEAHVEDDPIHVSGILDAIVGAAGQEPWNIGVLEDGEFVAVMENFESSHFVGVAEGPTGESMPYLRAGRKLFVLDFYARQITPIDVGAEGRLVSGCMHQGEVVVTDGWNVFAYSAKGNVRNLGLPKKAGFGIPPNLIVGNQIKKITSVFTCDTFLCCLVSDTSDTLHPTTTLFRHNGLGWHQVGAIMADFDGWYGFVLDADHNLLSNGRAIIIPGTTGGLVGINDLNPAVGYYQFTLPNLTHQSTVGVDSFGTSGAAFVCGWYDGGFLDIQGTLLRLNIDAWSLTASETVKVEYRLDNDESASWTQLVDINGVAAVFDSTHESLYFPGTDARAGIQFRTVQFRISLTRGADVTRSPELRALILTFLKTPQLRTSWTMAIDVNRMTERGAGDDTTFWVDGAPATLESVWLKLRDLWNTHTLLPLTIPNVQEDFYVHITDMPLTVDDFRNAVDGQGQVTIQVIEPSGV